jgi:hypothetical protein
MQQTISGELTANLTSTLGISCLFKNTSYVKILLRRYNPQVTKTLSSLVGTSEAIRLLSINTQANNYLKLDRNFITGFITGEGCFHISVLKSKTHKIGYNVILYFTLAQNNRDIELLKSFIKFFDCGRIRPGSTSDVAQFVVTRSGDIMDKIIPFFNSYPIQGIKIAPKGADFCKAVELVKNKAHLTSSGLEEINTLKSQMNRQREYLLSTSSTSSHNPQEENQSSNDNNIFNN